jgi:hypothetical protein
MPVAQTEPVAAPLADPELDLLERFKPVLRFDRQYDYRAASVQGVVENPGNVLTTGHAEVIARAGGEPRLTLELLSAYPDGGEPKDDDQICLAPNVLGDARAMETRPQHDGRLYGRVCEDGGRRWLQYWFWLYFNPKHLMGFGKHEGDWEMIQIGLGPDGEPELVGYAQHESGEARKAEKVEWVESDRGRHPVVYVAPYSHAAYFEPGAHPYVLGVDHPTRGGPSDLLPVERFGPWVEWCGHWGSSERVIAGRIGNGPRSPSKQGWKWEHPARFQLRLRSRWIRVQLGRLMHLAGRLTFPKPPRVSARLEGRACVVAYELADRRSRHLYLTVHEGRRVVASRRVRCAEQSGEERIRLETPPAEPLVCGSTFNRLRQRSEVAEAPVEGA